MNVHDEDDTARADPSITGLSWRDFFERLGNGSLKGPDPEPKDGVERDAMQPAGECPSEPGFR